MTSPLVNPAAAERFSSELGRMLFWLHHASGPIALGILTIAAVARHDSAILRPRSSGAVWSRSRWRQRRESRKVQ